MDKAAQYRLERLRRQSLKPRPDNLRPDDFTDAHAVVDCGWGRLIFAPTFKDPKAITEELLKERPERRDIAFYLREPHVVLSFAPQRLFLDPSHTYRLDLYTYRQSRRRFKGFHIRRLCTAEDANAVNRIYQERNMVPVHPDFYWDQADPRLLTHFVAEDDHTGRILGTVMGVDHERAFPDPDHGSSLWCLAVDPHCPHAGVGEALVRRLTEHFQARGRAFMDLSVLHDNEDAIALYEKLGFFRVPFFAIKNKNAINEKLFAGPAFSTKLNPYAMIIIEVARRRDVQVEGLDGETGMFRLSYAGRAIICRESLTELTNAIAMTRCANKALTRRLLGQNGLTVPAQISLHPREDGADDPAIQREIEDFLQRYVALVVKPADGEQGRGVTVDLRSVDEVVQAIGYARRFDEQVLIEQFVDGVDIRVIVIGYKVVAAAIRKPAEIVGDGVRTVRELIERQSRRRERATDGESSIPLDAETERCVKARGQSLDAVLAEDQRLLVRRTANLHTGGTIHDVTDSLHSTLVDASVRAARVLDIPVVGIDFIAPDPRKPDYVIIEANERPGLANHEPQPVAERFLDLLFPQSIPREMRTVRTDRAQHGPAHGTP